MRIDSGSYPQPGVFGAKEVSDYYITRLPAADAVTDPIDLQALALLFGQVAEGGDALWFGTLKKYGEDHPQEFLDAMQAWQGVVSAETNKQDFFELKGKRYQGYLIAVAGLVAMAGIAIAVFMSNFIPLIFMLPTAIAIGVIANYLPRRSVRGNNLVAKCKALRNWLRDFSTLDERPPTDVKVWGEFMVYAYLFGVAEQTIKQLQIAMPQLFEYDGSLGATYVPWWFWYTGAHTRERSDAAFGGRYAADVGREHDVDGAGGHLGCKRELLERRRLRGAASRAAEAAASAAEAAARGRDAGRCALRAADHGTR